MHQPLLRTVHLCPVDQKGDESPGDIARNSADNRALSRPLELEDVETGGLFRDEHGLPLRQDQDLRREIADIGAAGEEAEQYKRVVIGSVERARDCVQPERLATLTPSTWSDVAIP